MRSPERSTLAWIPAFAGMSGEGWEVEALTRLNAYLRRDIRAPVALGLSGGGDSLALLHLATAWAREVRRPILALTVDHGLHPDSAAWTARAGAMARAAGAQWRALAWTGAKPSTGLPAAARAARHRLLAEAAREAGAAVMLLAHTADDVAEGEWMRGTGAAPTLGRLRTWAPSPVWPQGRDIVLLRPLLHARGADLRAWLAARGLAWHDDPANADPRFARTRARAVMVGVLTRVEEAGVCDDASATTDASGALRLAVNRLSPRLLAAAFVCVGGGERPPGAAALEGAMDATRASRPFTLAGARGEREDATLRLVRELGRRPIPPLALSPGVETVWDGRFALTAAAPGWRVAPLRGLAARLPRAEREALRALSPEARPTLPAFLAPDGAPRLAPPLGDAPVRVRPLVLARLHAALGCVPREP